MKHMTETVFAAGMEAITKSRSNGKGALASAITSVVRYPVKSLAAFVMAPFLAYRIARFAKNPTRRMIARVGLVAAVILAWAAGTFIGSMAGALLVLSYFGPLVALGFALGTVLSIILSVSFSILVLNVTSWFFLQLSSEDVISHLKEISE